MRKLLRVLVWTAVVLGVLVGLLRAFVIRWWRIPETDAFLAASVAPTLAGGDLVVLWRLTPASFGDVVLCPEPGAPGRVVIGRIVGESGDVVSVNGNNVKVNNTGSGTEMNCPSFSVEDPNTGEPIEQSCDVETLNSHRHMRGNIGQHKIVPAPSKTEVGQGEVFLLSDNRLYPYDSRDFGPVQRDSCREAILFRIVGKGGLADVTTRLTYIQ